jgi:hypothetical protein
MGTRIGNHIRSNVVGYVAIFLFAMSGTAIALDGSNTQPPEQRRQKRDPQQRRRQ